MIQRGPRGGGTSMPVKANKHWPDTLNTKSSGLKVKVLPPSVISRFGSEDVLLQLMMYSLPKTLVAPTFLARSSTTSFGPASREVPLSIIAFCGEEMTLEPPNFIESKLTSQYVSLVKGTSINSPV